MVLYGLWQSPDSYGFKLLAVLFLVALAALAFESVADFFVERREQEALRQRPARLTRGNPGEVRNGAAGAVNFPCPQCGMTLSEGPEGEGYCRNCDTSWKEAEARHCGKRAWPWRRRHKAHLWKDGDTYYCSGEVQEQEEEPLSKEQIDRILNAARVRGDDDFRN
jgi:uncharacterized Zn finger protein (UPF0148 family)